jgi:hypothetical protein
MKRAAKLAALPSSTPPTGWQSQIEAGVGKRQLNSCESNHVTVNGGAADSLSGRVRDARRADALTQMSAAGGCYAQPVAIGVLDIALPSGEPCLVNVDPEFLRHGVDVGDIQMNERVRASVTLVLGQVETHASPGH